MDEAKEWPSHFPPGHPFRKMIEARDAANPRPPLEPTTVQRPEAFSMYDHNGKQAVMDADEAKLYMDHLESALADMREERDQIESHYRKRLYNKEIDLFDLRAERDRAQDALQWLIDSPLVPYFIKDYARAALATVSPSSQPE